MKVIMNKYDISGYSKLSELPLDEFETMKFTIYVLDKFWNYIYLNFHGENILNCDREDLIGKNMWEHFGALSIDPTFIDLRKKSELGLNTNYLTISPLNSKKLNILGYPLSDCYLFFVSILPNKDDLINELRNEITKTKKKTQDYHLS